MRGSRRAWVLTVVGSLLCPAAAAELPRSISQLLLTPTSQTETLTFPVERGTRHIVLDIETDLDMGQARFELTAPDGETLLEYDWGRHLIRDLRVETRKPGRYRATVGLRDAVGQYTVTVRGEEPATDSGAVPPVGVAALVIVLVVAAVALIRTARRARLAERQGEDSDDRPPDTEA